jgi:hypothetical protein
VAERWWSLPKSTWRVLTLLAGLIARGFALEYTPPSAGVDLVYLGLRLVLAPAHEVEQSVPLGRAPA